MALTENKRFYFQWHFLERCNLRCSHCYQENYQCAELDDSQLMTIAGILEDTLNKWQRDGRVSLTGGEPFLRKDLLIKLLDFFEASPAFYWIGILTNGTLIDQNIADRMKKFSKLNEIQISLDGATAEAHDAIRGKDSFDKAVRGLELLKRNGFTTSIMFTLHRQNRDQVDNIIDLAESLGVDFLTIERMTPFSQQDIDNFYMQPQEVKEVYESVIQKKKELERTGKLRIRTSRPLWGLVDEEAGGFCPAGFSSLSILHDGTVLPCRRLDIPIGNILEDGLYKIWYTSKVLWKLRTKDQTGGTCGDCELLGKCGGCRAIAYALTNDIKARDPQCWKQE